MEFKQLLDKLIDSNPSLRFAAVFDRYGTIKEKSHKDGASLMMDEYETQNMLREAANSWHHRNQLANKLGKGHYTMTVYDNLIRITIPLSSDYFLIISHDKLDDQPQLVKQIQQVVENNRN
jgi:hypothetical protein